MAVGLTNLLKTVVDNKASGLHLRGNSFAYVRLNTQIKQIEDSFMSNDEVMKIANACMGEREKKIFEEKLSVDFTLDAKEHGRFRFNVYRQSSKVGIAIRHIPREIPSFQDLNLPGDILKKIASNRRGLVLVCGVTGSGKSSTLATMIDFINKSRRAHILTLEDPIEFLHIEEKSIISQLGIGVDAQSYTLALRAAMRQDTDVIMIGEMRDASIIRDAVSAAEMGQLVFTTVHAASAVQAISRMVDGYPVEQHKQVYGYLSELLRGVVVQRLIPSIKGGMVPAMEIMVDSPQIKKLLLEGKVGDISRFIGQGEFYDMRTFDQDLVALHKKGMISTEVAVAAATSPDHVMLGIKGLKK